MTSHFSFGSHPDGLNSISPMGALPQGKTEDDGVAGAAASPLRILVVEDHPDTLSVLSRLLKLEGYHVHTAATAGDALRLAKAEPLDLIVSDIRLPDRNGYDFMREVQSQGGPVGIAMTGYELNEEDGPELARAGFVDYLVKPIQFDMLKAAIVRATAR